VHGQPKPIIASINASQLGHERVIVVGSDQPAIIIWAKYLQPHRVTKPLDETECPFARNFGLRYRWRPTHLVSLDS
jgi:hypothetical protein